ncbi:MAG TPA: preprotein translocase subunit SecG [Opitutales bacterium]|nr:preprotein translocase subunit SecG [Opitutales bacterium]
MSFVIGFFTLVLVLVAFLMVLAILMQRPRSDSGLGAALGGGGAAESAFGAESGNILSKSTLYFSVIFFVLSFGLYLGYMYLHYKPVSDLRELPEMSAPAATSEAFSEMGTPSEAVEEAETADESTEVIPEDVEGSEAAVETSEEETLEPEASEEVSVEEAAPESG